MANNKINQAIYNPARTVLYKLFHRDFHVTYCRCQLYQLCKVQLVSHSPPAPALSSSSGRLRVRSRCTVMSDAVATYQLLTWQNIVLTATVHCQDPDSGSIPDMASPFNLRMSNMRTMEGPRNPGCHHRQGQCLKIH